MNLLAMPAAVLLAAVAAEPDRKTDPYPEGEILEYRVKIKGLSGGSATLSVPPPPAEKETEKGEEKDEQEDQGRDGESGKDEGGESRAAATLTLRMRSSPFVSRFYPLDNSWTSVVETGSGGSRSLQFDKENERNRRELEEISIDPEKQAGTYYRRRHNGAEERREFRVEKPVQDTVSLFYHVRRLPLELGTSDTISFIHKDRVHELRLSVDGLERIKVPGVGVFWAKVVHPPSRAPGLFADEGSATMWLEETTHVMLRLVVQAPKGSASMMLVKAGGSPLLNAPGAEGTGR